MVAACFLKLFAAIGRPDSFGPYFLTAVFFYLPSDSTVNFRLFYICLLNHLIVM